QYKGHRRMLEAFERLAADHKDLHLVFVGDNGPEKEPVREAVARSRWRERIHLAGFQQVVLPFYQSLDALIVPSENEGLSNAVLEAMACGLPVVASEACGNAEVIEDGRDGLVADLSTPEKMVAR